MDAPLDDQIGVLAGHLHAATARFIDLATAFDESRGWAGVGMQSCAHWVTIATGIDLWNAREMLRVGWVLRGLPGITEAFAAGRLSFDKVRALSRVATAADESIWLEVALEASGSQLARICRQFRRSVAVDDPSRSALQRARRRVVSWWLDDDGMLALYATLPPEEGRLVLNAIESAVVGAVAIAPVDELDCDDGERAVDDPCAEDPAEHPHGARRADALVRICARWLDDAAAAAPPGTAPTELVVHVDAATLSGLDPGGRCHLEEGPAIALAAARRLACDVTLVTVAEHDGVPLDVGRSRRVVSGRMRRLLQLRDQGCRYPGCAVPAAATEGHHLVHWVDGGRTDLANLVSLCRFHHHRHHEGAFRMVPGDDGAGRRGGRLRFETAAGRPIGVPRLRNTVTLDSAGITPRTAAAADGGRSLDLDHTILVLAGAVASAAGHEQPSGP
ncbi:MAG: DUF222 domain-containing protein [Candidatus Dormibacteria bacterium]